MFQYKSTRPIIFILLLVSAFCFRLTYGLCDKFWSQDELEIYLLGLKYYTTGRWPYFGPDVVYTHSKIPGALQGLIVGLPLRAWPIPEAPFIFLNVLTFISLCLFAWYCGKRLPIIPRGLLWSWLLFAPWTLNFSTHVVNPSFVLPGAILFWFGFFEAVPSLSKSIAPQAGAFCAMGFSLLWIFQLHMSWVLLLPFILIAFVLIPRATVFRSLIYFVLGASLSGSLILPTLVTFGLDSGSGNTGANVQFLPGHARYILEVISRFFSFSTFTIVGSLGKNMDARIAFGERHWWAVPFIFVVAITGAVQIAYMIFRFFKHNPRGSEWQTCRYVTLAAIVITYLSFLFSVKGPSAHAFYLLLPLAMLYAFYCFELLSSTTWLRLLAGVIVFSGIVVHIALSVDNFGTRSLYHDRATVVRAIEKGDYTILGVERYE